MIYFDNAATTKMDISVVEAMNKAFEEDFANPSSLHKLGFNVEKKIRATREQIAKILKVKSEQIFFAPSASIANNTVVFSQAKKGKNILLSEVEHSSLSKIVDQLDCEIRLLKVDQYGRALVSDMLDKIDDNTVLVSIMHVQNELGTINDINELARLAKEKNPKILFHSDGVQAFKKIDVNLKDIDFYTFSGHKINGPKGIGGLFVRNKKSISPIYYGGGQENGLFSGTENTYAIAALGQAIKLENNFEIIAEINSFLRKELENIEGARILSPSEEASPYILNVTFSDIGAEILLHYLEMDDIYISTGSACSKGAESRTLHALGLGEEILKGAIRISFDRNSSLDQAKIFIGKLRERVVLIRSIVKR